ncbi:MAG: EAL domain-containing protein [Actinomycetota bacterium]
MLDRDPDWRPSGWGFPLRTTAAFLVLAACSLATLTWIGLGELRLVNEYDALIRIDRAGRAAAELFDEGDPTAVITRNDDGSPMYITIDSAASLTPGATWDSLLDQVADVNQGAANIFRYNTDTGAFDRISTTFRTPEGDRVGGSQVERGLISDGHPAYESMLAMRQFVGEVPVSDSHRFAYLTPIVDPAGSPLGLLAVDVGWIDDLNRVNGDITNRMLIVVSSLLVMVAGLAILVMFYAFRPLHRLIEVANEVGEGNRTNTALSLRNRKDEIGYLAAGLSKVVDLQEDLQRRAYTDNLTDIPNRAAFVHELERRFGEIDLRTDHGAQFALLIIDLDGFKDVNDGLGHQAGDDVLISIASSLQRALQPGEFVARLGGDEFAVLTAQGIAAPGAIEDATARALASVSGVHQTNAGETTLTASVGVALIPEHGASPQMALRHADLALYAAKHERRGQASVYHHRLSQPTERRIHVAAELRKALEQGEIGVEYQPLYTAADGQLHGVEALARWYHPVEGPIPPLEFVRVAETAGLINELGRAVIEQVCEQIGLWHRAGLSMPVVAVNISTMQLWNPTFVEAVRGCMEHHGVPTGRLCLELTESIIVQHEDGQHRELLDELIDLGIVLSIDDFGTGYSSLSYLHNLPVHQVKIDRMFVSGAANDPKQAQLYAGVIALAQNLGLEVVTEGVETADELRLARAVGTDLVQGFHLGRAMPADSVADLFGTESAPWGPGRPART